MYNKKSILLLCMIVFSLAFVSSAQPSTFITNNGDAGLEIAYRPIDFLKTGEDYRVHLHVFNRTATGLIPLRNDTTDCFYHLYNSSGFDTDLQLLDFEDYNGVDFAKTIDGSQFTNRGYYSIILQCNTTGNVTDYATGSFYVNDYGEELTEATSSNFNYSMLFLMFLFLITVVGIFKVDHYIGKFVLYWFAHILFIVGSFSVWQFNTGYGVSTVGLAGVFKIMFFVSISAVLPMLILSLAWIFYIHAFNEHFQKLVDKGIDTEEAFRLTNKKRKGWLHGQ